MRLTISPYAVLFLLTWMTTTNLTAQDVRMVDSLLHVLGQAKSPQTIPICIDISHAYLNTDRVMAMEYAQRALKEAEELDSARWIGASLNTIGNVHQNTGKYQEAIEAHRKALNIQEKIGDNRGMANSYSGIGLVYDLIGEDSLGLEYQLKALELSKVVKDRKGEAVAYNNIGILYSELGNDDQSIVYFKKALAIYEEMGNEKLVADEYSNLASANINSGKHQQAIDYENKSLEVRQRIGDRKGVCISLTNLGSAYGALGEYDRAIAYLQESLDSAHALGDLSEVVYSQSLLSTYYEQTGQYEKALEAERAYAALQDSLFGQQKQQQITRLQVEFETERKVHEIDKLNKERQLQQAKIEQQALIRNFSIGFILFIFFMLFLFYRHYKISQEKKQMALAQQLELEKLEGEKLMELDQLKTSFFTNVAHELRTPLTLLMGPVEQIMENTREPSTRNMVKLMRRNTDQLLKLVNQILDISRLDAGMGGIQPQKGDFVAFIRGLVMSFQSLAHQKHIKLDVDIKINAIEMVFDAEQLEKVFSNLLSNAFKFTPKGGQVSVSLKESENDEACVVVSVADTGMGIPEDKLPWIFDRFYQAHTAADGIGTGIGLALAKELTILHGGEISVQSKIYEGSVFTVKLPLHLDFKETTAPVNDSPISADLTKLAIDLNDCVLAEVSEPKTTLPDQRNEATPESSREIVLIIEDNTDVQKFIAHTLQKKYDVLKASNGKEGVAMAIAYIPDLIISDVMMPVMDGYEACRIIKANINTSHIPVVLLTAKAGMDHKLEGLETGADDYLSKPFNAKELLVRTKNLIEVRKSLREKYAARMLEGMPQIVGDHKENGFLDKIKTEVLNHLDNELFGVQELSRELAMSRTQLHRKLKALTNQSASQFIRVIRLQKGKEMLLTGEYNVAQVAYQVGFNSPTYFSSCFMEQYGYAPSEAINHHS